MVARDPTGCQECRDKHLKCDKIEPVCGRCAASNRRCNRETLFKNQKKKYSHDQKWVDLSSSDDLQWILYANSKDIESAGEYVSEDEDEQPSSPPTENTSMSNATPMASSTSPTRMSSHQGWYVPSPRQGNFGSRSDSTISTPHRPMEPAVSHAIHNVFLPTEIPLSKDSSRELRQTPPIHTENSAWPLKSAREARLFGHYVLDLAKWLDLCDPNQHFQVEVPKRAAKCPVLLNAILALSARHLAITKRQSEYDEIAARQYYGDCIQLLIPMLDCVVTRADEALFAALIILRVLEEIDVLETGTQGLAHIAGIQSFVREHGSNLMQGGLGEAAFWVGLRQEIYVATLMHRAVQIEIGHIDRSIDPVTDFEWANRAVVHLADVLNCCFDPRGVDPEYWTKLQTENDRWQHDKPDSFTPYYYRNAHREKREAFPEILHIHPCHIIGIQHHKLAHILLLSCNPKIPRIGKGRYEAENAMLQEIKDNLRELCGIGLHNRATPPGMFTACMGIAMCGDRFDDRLEQESLLQLLIETEIDHARPTAAIQKQMKTAWGWDLA